VLIVSHDIKSSLGAIQRCLEVVLDGLTGEVSEKSREMIERAKKRSEELMKFLKELLDLSRMRAQKNTINLKLKDISSLINKVLSELENYAKKKNVVLNFSNNLSPNHLVSLDENMFIHMLENLLSNAIKYNKPQGMVNIKLYEVNEDIYLSIEDTGIGIKKEDLSDIFNDFFRADNAFEMENGTGLGLAIVKQIVNSHKWEISVESEINSGNRFVIKIPKEGE
jgi:signal transduction histidine kinase